VDENTRKGSWEEKGTSSQEGGRETEKEDLFRVRFTAIWKALRMRFERLKYTIEYILYVAFKPTRLKRIFLLQCSLRKCSKVILLWETKTRKRKHRLVKINTPFILSRIIITHTHTTTTTTYVFISLFTTDFVNIVVFVVARKLEEHWEIRKRKRERRLNFHL